MIKPSNVDSVESKIQENITNWQSTTNPLAPLTDEQFELIYQVEDLLKDEFYETKDLSDVTKETTELPASKITIDSNRSFLKWFTAVEAEMKNEHLSEYQQYCDQLKQQSENIRDVYKYACDSTDFLESLQVTHKDVISKTDYLHDLSEELMKQQRILKNKKDQLNKNLKYFTKFDDLRAEAVININSKVFTDYLDSIVEAIEHLSMHLNYKEARIYKMKNESLLLALLDDVYKYVENIVSDVSKQVVNSETKSIAKANSSASDLNIDSAFSIFYGKFQSAARKVNIIIPYLEDKENANENYKNTLVDCHKMYLSQRLPILSVAVSKALTEIKEKHRNDHSILFRSCGLFSMKVCQDEANCFHYFFQASSEQLDNYLGNLCQNLYDCLRPSLISINHIEVLSELCGIMRKEMLNDKATINECLKKYVETIRQLLEDVEERLVFRTNVFFQHDLMGYTPSSGDLAYPEKLIQMENIAIELQERRTESRSSVVSLESQEVANINAGPSSHFRSYTGNSPADLHGMWYPTVKRTLVCLSRLYVCLDRETFQGLAQEALAMCINTVSSASSLISDKKSEVDGGLFEIKHLLIIREQIAPFQVDFTVKETTLDFSGVQKAAVDLIHRRDKIFTFGSNNALLEFLLEGTPKVRQYLIDSRKEIDKQLKFSCEAFIAHCTRVLIGNLLQFIQMSERFKKAAELLPNPISLRTQEFAMPEKIAQLVIEAQKNLKLKIPDIQRSMQLYLANRETEFILFRPIKNNVINAFIQIAQILVSSNYSCEDVTLVGCPSAVQVSVLISSVSLTAENEGANKNVS